jgi:hypothetical protein
MKKIIMTAIVCIAISTATQAQFKVGFLAGGNLSTQKRNDLSTSSLFTKHAYRGFHAGLVAEVPLTENLYIQPQLLYAKKGVNFKDQPAGMDRKLTLNTIEMPVLLLHKTDVPFGKIIAGAGPVISYGFNGKLNESGNIQKIYDEGSHQWRRVDVGVMVKAGLEFNNGFFVSANYQKGYKDLNKTVASVKSRAFNVSVGYLIDWKKLTNKG